MEQLEKIWHKLDALEKAIGELIAKDAVKETYQLLKQEESSQKKWGPWALPYIFLVMVFITGMTGAYTSIVSLAGIALITLGAYLMVYFIQKGQIDLQGYEANPSAVNFDEMIRKPLKKRVHYIALGVAIYILSLTFGLHLLIFGVASLAGKGGILGTFYGVMFGATGAVTGSIYAMHTKKYEVIFNPKYKLSFTDFKMQ